MLLLSMHYMEVLFSKEIHFLFLSILLKELAKPHEGLSHCYAKLDLRRGNVVKNPRIRYSGPDNPFPELKILPVDLETECPQPYPPRLETIMVSWNDV